MGEGHIGLYNKEGKVRVYRNSKRGWAGRNMKGKNWETTWSMVGGNTATTENLGY